MKRLLALTALLLTGCQTVPPTTEAEPSRPADEAAVVAPPLEPASFSPDTLYALLVAELAGQRNRFDIALGNYVQQAHATGDPGVAERAFRIAEYLGAEQAALDTALIWAGSAPDSLDAQRAAAIQLARAGRYEESLDYMERLLRQDEDTPFDFLALSAARSDPQVRAGLLQSFDRLQERHPGNPQLRFGKALLLEQDEQPEAALALLEAAPEAQRPPALRLLQARLLQRLERPDDAIEVLAGAARAYPDDKRLRLAYARQLVEAQRLEEAIGEFAALLQQNPTDDGLRLSLALVALEAEAWREATVYLEDLIERGSHLDAAWYHLGRARQALGDSRGALEAYARVEPGNEYLAAQAQQATLLGESGRLDEAANLLAQAREAQPDYAVQLYLLEVETLSDAGRLEQAQARLTQALAQFPEDLDLIYTRAMLAEQRDDLAQLERDLRFVLEREPDNAMALNALGYTLADRTERLEEALELIDQAHRLNPEDPAILDSKGWVHYRLGHLEEAERWLRQAFARMPDPEIAAHLGEVLWQRGQQREARRIWAQAAEQAPDSPILRDTLRRLTGSETL